MIIALPKRRQTEALFCSIEKDLPTCVLSDRYFQAVHSGKVQKSTSNTEEILGDDINVVVFDQLLKSFYHRGSFNQFVLALKSDVVFDEYHEFIWIPLMLPSLMVFLKIRSWFENGGKTLLLSGTPDPSLNYLLFKYNNIEVLEIDRSKLSEVSADKATYSFEEEFSFNNNDETLYTYNRVKDVQESYIIENKENYIMHSKYTEKDLKENIEKILLDFKKGHVNKKSIHSAMILQSSFDISFKNAKIVASHPNTVAQFLGRKNRHGDKSGGSVVFYPEYNVDFFKSNKAGFYKTYLNFEKHLRNLFLEPKELTHREATILIYDDFWTEKQIEQTKEELMERFIKAVKDMENNKPRKIAKKKTIKSSGSIFRGSSVLISLESFDNRGISLGMLDPENCIGLSGKWQIEETKKVFDFIAIDLKEAGLKAALKGTPFLNGELLKRNSWKIGKEKESPYFLSHSNELISKSIRKAVDKENTIGYTIYNNKLGLISEVLFNEYLEGDKK
jgi:hypothetical protein